MASLGNAVDGAVESVAPKALNGGKMAVRGGKKAGKMTVKTADYVFSIVALFFVVSMFISNPVIGTVLLISGITFSQITK